MDPSVLEGRCLFAIPKKGRLYEKCLELLKGADIQFVRSHRLDVALVRNHNMALVFLPASDIPRFVGEGNVDLGITGQDMVAEANMSSLITEILPLGFGKCKLQIQVPLSSGITEPSGLVGKKIATSFEVLAGRYFKELDGEGEKTTIEYIGGSVEAACALGVADGIVDLVESGETMRAAGLTAIHTLLSSEAVLIKSSTPHSGSNGELIARISSRIEGVIAAGKYVLCSYNIPRAKVSEAIKITPGRRAASISSLETKDGDWVAISSMVLKAEVAGVMDRLQAIGAEDILNIGLSNCRV